MAEGCELIERFFDWLSRWQEVKILVSTDMHRPMNDRWQASKGLSNPSLAQCRFPYQDSNTPPEEYSATVLSISYVSSLAHLDCKGQVSEQEAGLITPFDIDRSWIIIDSSQGL